MTSVDHEGVDIRLVPVLDAENLDNQQPVELNSVDNLVVEDHTVAFPDIVDTVDLVEDMDMLQDVRVVDIDTVEDLQVVVEMDYRDVVVAAELEVVEVVVHHDNQIVAEMAELVVRTMDWVEFEDSDSDSESYCVVVAVVVVVEVVAAVVVVAVVVEAVVELHYNLPMVDWVVDHRQYVHDVVVQLEVVVRHRHRPSVVLDLIVKYGVAEGFAKYFALNRLIALSIQDFGARLGGTTCTHLLCLNSEILEWSESVHNSRLEFSEYALDWVAVDLPVVQGLVLEIVAVDCKRPTSFCVSCGMRIKTIILRIVTHFLT